MNHLAHALLGGESPDLLLGSILGDFVHGPVPEDLRMGVRVGIRLHRAIDVYTDTHAITQAARAQFPAPYRRYAGIILDVWFDHLLARDFARWSAVPLASYSTQLIEILEAHAGELPTALAGYVRYMRRHGLPAAYAHKDAIAAALAGIGMRLSRANPLDSALNAIAPLEASLQRSFDEFFPELQEFAKIRLSQLLQVT
ncbi:MAG: ACP phosphodiesterase [Tahibacter sp.]